MNEEEIIEIIEKLQCEYKEQENENKYNDYTVFKAKEYYKGLQGLLDLYNKQKEKNKAIEVARKDLPKDVEFVVVTKEDFKRNFGSEYISKDKIREKIKEIDKYGDNETGSPPLYKTKKGIEILKEDAELILEELLEE